MNTRIRNCQTIAELRSIERAYTLDETEQRLLFERQMDIFHRIREWREENSRLGLRPDFTDTWTPEQREAFMCDWLNDESLLQISEETGEGKEDVMQTGRGEKRPIEDVNEGASTSDNVNEEVSNRFFKVLHDIFNNKAICNIFFNSRLL